MLYSGVSMLTLTPFPKVPERSLAAPALARPLEVEVEVARAVWTALLICGWRLAMICAIRADWSTAEEVEATPLTPLDPENEVSENPELDDPENPEEEEEDPENPEEAEEPSDWVLIETNPSCLSVTAENPIGPAS